MRAYFDTGIIAKWYVAEDDSDAALALRERFSSPCVLTHLHRLELTAAWRAKVFRRELSDDAATQALEDLRSDLEAGVWLQPAYDLVAVYALAEHLCRRHTATLGTHALDTLHVAAALELGETTLVTGDQRQAQLGKAVGLRVTRLR